MLPLTHMGFTPSLCRGSITWNKLPDTIKNTKHLATLVDVLKTSIIPCTCKICKTF